MLTTHLHDSDSQPKVSSMHGFGGKCCIPICPKPRHLSTVFPDILKPQQCSNHNAGFNVDGKNGLVSKVAEKEAICTGCLPDAACYSGSPPSRLDNPVIRDVQFIRKMQFLSPFKLSDKLSF